MSFPDDSLGLNILSAFQVHVSFTPRAARERSQILSPVDATASTSLWIQPPNLQEECLQAPAASTVYNEALIYSQLASLCFREGFSTVKGFFFSFFLVKHITSSILIIFPFLPALYYSPDNVFLMFDLVGFIDFCKYMLMTATTTSWNKLRQQQQQQKTTKKVMAPARNIPEVRRLIFSRCWCHEREGKGHL